MPFDDDDLLSLGEGSVGAEDVPLPKYLAPVVRGASLGLVDDTPLYDYKEITPAFEDSSFPTMTGEGTIESPEEKFDVGDAITLASEATLGELAGTAILSVLGRMIRPVVKPVAKVVRNVADDIGLQALTGGQAVRGVKETYKRGITPDMAVQWASKGHSVGLHPTSIQNVTKVAEQWQLFHLLERLSPGKFTGKSRFYANRMRKMVGDDVAGSIMRNLYQPLDDPIKFGDVPDLMEYMKAKQIDVASQKKVAAIMDIEGEHELAVRVSKAAKYNQLDMPSQLARDIEAFRDGVARGNEEFAKLNDNISNARRVSDREVPRSKKFFESHSNPAQELYTRTAEKRLEFVNQYEAFRNFHISKLRNQHDDIVRRMEGKWMNGEFLFEKEKAVLEAMDKFAVGQRDVAQSYYDRFTSYRDAGWKEPKPTE